MFDFILKAGPNRLYAALAIIAVVAALLFGLMHWLPLARAAKAKA